MSTWVVTEQTKPIPLPKDPVFNSAPTSPPEPVFVMQDPTGLLGQLFLTNRYMGGATPGTPEENAWNNNDPQSWNNQIAATIIDSLDSVILDEFEGPVILRQIARLFILEASWSENPVSLYEYGIEKISLIQAPDDSRIAYTREHILRIFEQKKKRYEDEVYRMTYSRFEDTMNSASEDIESLDF